MIVIKEKVCCTHRSLEKRGMAHYAGPHEEALESVRKQRKEGGKSGHEPLLWFLWERMGKVG